ncbi:MAG: hypothetical protein F9K51_04205 [Candidatus Dadabacteria bacterium]|nr:MAG: hypothetical protein F9K51_04205 [Candidatus Dadabacteria bacterium]
MITVGHAHYSRILIEASILAWMTLSNGVFNKAVDGALQGIITFTSRMLRSMNWRMHKAYELLFSSIPYNSSGDNIFTLLMFIQNHGRLPNQKMNFNDYLYRLKTSGEGNNPLRSFVTDKEFVKLYIRGIIGDEFLVPTISVLRSSEEVAGYNFPPRCCIKPTHLSGPIIFRMEGEPVDLEEIANWFSRSHYRNGREANYRTLKPKVIVEPMLFDNDNLHDYKIFCYKGVPKLIQVDVNRYIKHERKFYDCSWREMPFTLNFPLYNGNIEKPENLDMMLKVASDLSKNFEFIRIDLYSNGTQLYVGELTSFPGNIEGDFIPLNSEEQASSILFN